MCKAFNLGVREILNEMNEAIAMLQFNRIAMEALMEKTVWVANGFDPETVKSRLREDAELAVKIEDA